MDTINDIQFLSGRFIIKYHPSLQDESGIGVYFRIHQ